MEPETLIEAVRYFADLEICNQYMCRIKWPDGKVACPNCGGERIGEIKSRHLIRCKECRKQFSYKVGTIFEDSPLGLDKWFVAVWAIANCRNGISSHELGRALGVTQKTAWFMLHRIRLAMEAESFDKFDGPAEADTTYVGGKAANMHKRKRANVIVGRGAAGKTAVHGILQRSGEAGPSRVSASVIGEESGVKLTREVRKHVAPGATVYTDSATAYGELCFTHAHKSVDHSADVWVDGPVHTNSLENFWTLLKRGLKGTYVSVMPFHLFRYVHEQAFRFNNRAMDDFSRFWQALNQVLGKRITYRTLTAKDDAGFMGIE